MRGHPAAELVPGVGVEVAPGPGPGSARVVPLGAAIRRPGVSALRVALRVVLVVALGCAAGTTLPAAAAGASDVLLPEHDPSRIDTTQAAREALAATESRRRELQAQWKLREQDCHKRFLMSPCLTDLKDDQRVADRRLKQIEIRARQVLRDAQAVGREQRTADELQRREARRADDEAQRAEVRTTMQQRTQANQDKLEQRARDDVRRGEEAQATNARRAERERELEKRRADLERRRRDAPANARAQRQRLAEHERARREREERSARDGGTAPAPAGSTAPRGTAAVPAAPAGSGAAVPVAPVPAAPTRPRTAAGN